ncbi:hypothetical protein [Nitrosospira multiformis]|uniref:hypothetical protein n=1 Tax=Nitrosospira multiformis TaxID=1231 RepID=UPI002109CA7E|nr:hypothetical protein [Nitrosospira multiformis]
MSNPRRVEQCLPKEGVTRRGFTGAMNIRFLYRSINFPESRRQRLGASAEGGAVPSEGRCDRGAGYWHHEY